jgi:hypothetical protein
LTDNVVGSGSCGLMIAFVQLNDGTEHVAHTVDPLTVIVLTGTIDADDIEHTVNDVHPLPILSIFIGYGYNDDDGLHG